MKLLLQIHFYLTRREIYSTLEPSSEDVLETATVGTKIRFSSTTSMLTSVKLCNGVLCLLWHAFCLLFVSLWDITSLNVCGHLSVMDHLVSKWVQYTTDTLKCRYIVFFDTVWFSKNEKNYRLLGKSLHAKVYGRQSLICTKMLQGTWICKSNCSDCIKNLFKLRLFLQFP